MSGTNGKATAAKKFAGRAIRGYQPSYWDRYLFHPALRDGRFSLRDVPAMTQDNAISIGLLTIFGPLFGAQHEVRANSKEIKTFVENTLYRFWNHDLGKVLEQYVAYGTAVGEVLYERDLDSGHWKYAGLDDFNILYGVQAFRKGRHLSRVRVSGGPMMMPILTEEQTQYEGAESNELRAPKLFWCAHRTTCGQIYGRSAMEASWGPWGEKCFSHGALSIRKLWCFSNAFRGCWVRYPPGTTTWNGVDADNQDIARQIAENAMSGATGVLPSAMDEDGHPLWELVDPRQHGDIAGMLEYPTSLSRDIWQGMGVLDEVISAPDVGAALSGHQGPLSGPMKIFLDIENMRVRELTTAFDVGPSGYTTRNEESGGVIRPLVLENFGPKAKYEIRPLNLIPKPTKEPGAGGSPQTAPAAATQGPSGGMPAEPKQPQPNAPMKLSQAETVAVAAELPDADVAKILGDVSLSDSGGWKAGDGVFHPIAAGLVVKAMDTGRVLMLQRGISEKDRAAGKWEFPGGHIDGREMASAAAQREWQEEVGLPLPSGFNVLDMAWEGSNGKYAGFIYPVASEDVLDLHHRDMSANPDGDAFEAVAWVDPKNFANHNLRRELLADVTRVRRAINNVADTSLSAGLFDEQDHPRADHGRFTHKPISAEHVTKAQKAFKAQKLSAQHSADPITSDASGEQIKHHVTLESGQRVHPDELHRLRVEDGETLLDHDEGLTIHEPGGKSDAKSFGEALHKISAFWGKPDEPVTVVSKHGYSATRPRSEWMDQHAGEITEEDMESPEYEKAIDLAERATERLQNKLESQSGKAQGYVEQIEDMYEDAEKAHDAFNDGDGPGTPDDMHAFDKLLAEKGSPYSFPFDPADSKRTELELDENRVKPWIEIANQKLKASQNLYRLVFHRSTLQGHPGEVSYELDEASAKSLANTIGDKANASLAKKGYRITPNITDGEVAFDVKKIGGDTIQSFSAWYDQEGREHTGRRVEHDGSATEASAEETEDFFEPDKLGHQGRLAFSSAWDPTKHPHGEHGHWAPKGESVPVAMRVEEMPVAVIVPTEAIVAPPIPVATIAPAPNPPGLMEDVWQSVSKSLDDLFGSDTTDNEPPNLALLQYGSYLNTVGNIQQHLAKIGVTDWLATDLQQDHRVRAEAWKNNLFLPDLYRMIDQAAHFATKDEDRQRAFQKMNEVGALMDERKEARPQLLPPTPAPVEIPAKPAHYRKKGAAQINIKAATEHLALGGTANSAVDHLMKFGGLAKPTARKYVRQAVKIAADKVNGEILRLQHAIAVQQTIAPAPVIPPEPVELVEQMEVGDVQPVSDIDDIDANALNLPDMGPLADWDQLRLSTDSEDI